jgi:ABC-type amino acid transport system permease subunit
MKTLRYIILPQMFRNVLPAFNNEFESMLKSTAILSSIGMLELTRMGMNIVSRELKQPLAIYMIVAVFYVILSIAFNFIAKRLEKQMLKKVRA